MKEWQALAKASSILDSLKRGLSPVASRQTLGDWYDTARLPSIQITNRSWKEERCRFNAHIRPVIGDRLIADITQAELARLVASLHPAPSSRQIKAHLKPATKNRVIALLGVIFSTLQEQGFRADNPAKLLKHLPERNRRKRILQAHEYTALYAALEKEPEWFRLLILLLLFTGMRLKEALTCRWSYVNFQCRYIQIPSDQTKGGDVRVIPLSEPAIAICRKLNALHGGNLLFPGKQNDAHMTRPSKRLVALFSRAGIQEFNAHDLRRSAGTQAGKHGPNHLVSKLLGHSNTLVTELYLAGPASEVLAMADGVGADFTSFFGLSHDEFTVALG